MPFIGAATDESGQVVVVVVVINIVASFQVGMAGVGEGVACPSLAR